MWPSAQAVMSAVCNPNWLPYGFINLNSSKVLPVIKRKDDDGL
jgi:hypothetical protein